MFWYVCRISNDFVQRQLYIRGNYIQLRGGGGGNFYDPTLLSDAVDIHPNFLVVFDFLL